MVYPENELKSLWDTFLAFVLIFTCIVTPLQIAMVEEVSTEWQIINYLVDLLFLTDIIIIFNTAIYDDDY